MLAFVCPHFTPQPPQLLGVAMEVSQPVLPLRQWAFEPRHSQAQTPFAHEGVPLVVLQARPQAPQWLASVAVFTHDPLQQVPSAPQDVPHWPQWAPSRLRSTHRLSQQVRLSGQPRPPAASHPGRQTPVELHIMPSAH
jgi:hypothetical protein